MYFNLTIVKTSYRFVAINYTKDHSVKKINKPHDRLFQSCLRNKRVLTGFLQTHLPTHVLSRVDMHSIEILSQSFVNERLRLKESDLLISANISDRCSYIYFLCEHQSKVDHTMPLRLWAYLIQFLAYYATNYPKSCQEKNLPVIVPLLYYNGECRYHGPLDFFELFGKDQSLVRETMLAPCHLIDLNIVNDKTLKASD